jgi:hypothetical protein
MRRFGLILLGPLLLAPGVAAQTATCAAGNSSGKTPLIDLVGGTYKGFPGGLYPGTGNSVPPVHLQAALGRAAQIVPLDALGRPDPVCGLIGMVSIGMSNTSHEFAQFERDEDINPLRNQRLVLLNGAQGGKAASIIRDPNDVYWGLVNNRVAAVGLTPAQVQVIWMEELNEDPPDDFPLHAQVLRDDLEAIVQNLHAKFPNLRLCYLSDRSYGGYTTTINPEPQAYETGFAVQWLIQDQIQGDPALNFDPANGPVMAPLLLWGPYLWADGILPNSLGTRWCACDFESCGNVHPSAAGEKRVGNLLSLFFAHDVTTQTWYPAPILNGAALWRDAVADSYVLATDGDDNFGDSPLLLSDSNPLAFTYVRFDVNGITRPLLHAKLNFRNPEVNLSADEREVYIVPDSNWGELTITWNNRPALGDPIGVFPRATRDGTRSLDVTAEVNADPDGVITFAVTPTVNLGPASLLTSREGGAAPRLVMLRGTSQPVVYCTAGISASGCQASIGAQGIASATAPAGFVLSAQNVERDKSGIFFYGTNGRQVKPWGNGTSLRCVVSPVQRGGLMNASGATEVCSGDFALDLNARWCPTCPHPGHNPGPGALVNAQLWYRDPFNTSNQTTSMSDAVEFTVCP